MISSEKQLKVLDLKYTHLAFGSKVTVISSSFLRIPLSLSCTIKLYGIGLYG